MCSFRIILPVVMLTCVVTARATDGVETPWPVTLEPGQAYGETAGRP
jgi:hypothetical protein